MPPLVLVHGLLDSPAVFNPSCRCGLASPPTPR